MPCDSRLMREAPRREARLGPKGESGGANGNRTNLIDHRRFDCMAEYAGECVCGIRAIPSGRAASLRPQPPSAFSQSGIPIARKGG
jgi:hypothetical protein